MPHIRGKAGQMYSVGLNQFNLPFIACWSHKLKWPEIHWVQVKQCPPCHPPPTVSPTLYALTSGPTATISPTSSCPGMRGRPVGKLWCCTTSSLTRAVNSVFQITRLYLPCANTTRQNLHNNLIRLRVLPGDRNGLQVPMCLEEGVGFVSC